MGPDAHEYVFQVGPRLDTAQLARVDQAVRDGTGGSAALGRKVQVVLPAKGHPAQEAFEVVIIDLGFANVQVPRECLPVVGPVADRLPDWTLGWDQA